MLRSQAWRIQPPTPMRANPLPHTVRRLKLWKKFPKSKKGELNIFKDLVEIETFDKDTVDTDQLAALIKEKATTELEFATTMGELRINFLALLRAATTQRRTGLTRHATI
ncbi:hypothetical protein TNCV_1717621 [Trichonephila clavipes]|nr:hypothetical protein TNCV_1717621 [Trichonephila clavipes]